MGKSADQQLQRYSSKMKRPAINVAQTNVRCITMTNKCFFYKTNRGRKGNRYSLINTSSLTK